MNARIRTIIFLFFIVLLTACGAAATPKPAAEAVQEIIEEPPVEVPAQPAEMEIVKTVEVIVEKEVVVQATRPALTDNQPQPLTNTFKDYGTNPYIDTIEDHLSTFGLDVDTASYTVARRYVNDGLLPPADAVRVEEFVNYFEPGYSTPTNVAFGIFADGAPSPFHSPGTYILRFGIQGYEVSEADRKPANLTFVIDVSGSMDLEYRLGLVKQSLELLVDRLRPNDSVSIVVYGTEARTVLYPTNGEDRRAILNAIYSLEPEGSTNAESGLRLGYDMAYRTFHSGAINRVILCSDGVANVGATGPDAILESIRGYADKGITLTTVGFGMGNFNDVLMEQLADKGDGHYAYVDNIDEAEKLFVDDLTSTLQVIARDAKVQVDFNPDVVARYRLIGYENRDIDDEDFRNDQVDAGELGAGHSATALYAVTFNPGAEGRIATIQLRWENPDTRVVEEINGNFNTWDLTPTFESTDPHYQLAVVVSQYAELLRLSPWVQESTIYQVLDHAVRLAGLLPGDDDVSEFAALVSRASQIQALQDW
jgi:Ca-activated chloride channel homolog